MSEEAGLEEPMTEGAPESAMSRRVAIRLGLFMAGASTIAWTEPSVSTLTLAHGAAASPLCVDEDDPEDTDHSVDDLRGNPGGDSHSEDSSLDCEDSDESEDKSEDKSEDD